jgi:hypothetical protein
MNKSIIAFAALLGSTAITGVAHADHRDTKTVSWNKLAEVSADPRDGTDVLEISTRARFDRLELRAREGDVELAGMTIYFADGTSYRPHLTQHIEINNQQDIDLPARSRPIDAIEFDYVDTQGTTGARTKARLEVWAYGDATTGDRYDDNGRYDDRRGDRYDRRGHYYGRASRLIDSQAASGRRGVVTFEPRRTRGRDLQLVTSDRSIKIRMIEVADRNGNWTRIAPVQGADQTVDLELGRGVRAIRVHYVSRARRGGEIALVTGA